MPGTWCIDFRVVFTDFSSSWLIDGGIFITTSQSWADLNQSLLEGLPWLTSKTSALVLNSSSWFRLNQEELFSTKAEVLEVSQGRPSSRDWFKSAEDCDVVINIPPSINQEHLKSVKTTLKSINQVPGTRDRIQQSYGSTLLFKFFTHNIFLVSINWIYNQREEIDFVILEILHDWSFGSNLIFLPTWKKKFIW